MYQRIMIAPMMKYTDKYFRYMMRLITKKTTLFTEMISSNMMVNNNNCHTLLKVDKIEPPIIIQLGGNNIKDLLYCSQKSEDLGYNEINLNIGCPSINVQKGNFGLSLMKDPVKVAKIIEQLKKNINIPISIKCRIGVDDLDSYNQLKYFIQQQYNAGIDCIYIHARKGYLKGLNPKKNRNIPPINYQFVYQIKKDFPKLRIGINGEIKTYKEMTDHLQYVDDIMIGRQAYNNPMIFNEIDSYFFQSQHKTTILIILNKMVDYIDNMMIRNNSIKINHITKHMFNLFKNSIHAKQYKEILREYTNTKNKYSFLLKIHKILNHIT